MRCANLVSAFGLAGLALAAEGDLMTKARLVLPVATARAGDTVLVGVRFEMAPPWHIYWRNPGESGVPTSVEWKLPKGVTAGPIQWPAPHRFTAGGLTTYVYDTETVLLAPLQLASNLPAGRLELAAKVSWLECDEACVQGNADLKANLVVGYLSQPTAEAALIDSWRKQVPAPNPALEAQARWETPPADETGVLLIEGIAQGGFQPTDFLAYGEPSYEVSPALEVLATDQGRFRLRAKLKRLDAAFPKNVAGILIQPGKDGRAPVAFEVDLTLPNVGPGPPASAPAQAAGHAATKAAAAAGSPSLLLMLGLAFVGGLILNVMPCVLPVIALKILGFVNQSREMPGRVRKLGVIYGLGVLASFLVLATAVIAVQRAGGSASWGMQMQNPFFRLALVIVVTLVALNLFGLFEVTLGGTALGAAAQLASKEGAAGSFFNGVLATALATPCTAPFLTVALGFAFTQSPAVIVLMFVATALGLAAPYVVLSWQPKWLRFLPKPGAWMVQFKIVMGFPMLATAVWLFDLTAPSFGQGGPLWLGLFLVLLALTAWIWGEFVQRGSRRKGLAMVICLLLLGFGYTFGLEGQLHWRSPTGATPSLGVIKDSPDGIEWRPWTPAGVEQARAQGHPVLVDFTAKWCLTCKSNKKIAIDIAPVRAKLTGINALAFRADNTDPNPAITAELRRYERAGVPLVLVFPPQPEKPPLVLPALLTPSIVLDALNQVAQ
jgi:thiol:disulfide interchange protein DsbD